MSPDRVGILGERGPKGANEIGKVYGRLTVLAETSRYTPPSGGRSLRQVFCRCRCGNEATVLVKKLRDGHTQSCGCLQRERTAAASTVHGHSRRGARTATHNTWRAMRERCSNPKHADWHRYGGRGVIVCDRWRTFENFLADMGERPAGRTLDRIDPNGNYESGNCRWATAHEQRINQRPRGTV